MSDLAWLVPLLPAVSAGLIVAIGRQLPKKGAEIGIVAIAVALARKFEVVGLDRD